MRPIWLLAPLAFASAVAHAEPLTFAEALARVDAAPDVAADALSVAAARSSARAAGALPDPRLQLGYDAFPVSGPTAGAPGRNDFSAVRVGVEQDVPNLAKRRARRDDAAAGIEASSATLVVETRKARVATALAWLDLYYAERKLTALGDLDRTLDGVRRTVPSRVSNGAARPAQSLESEQMIAALADRRTDLIAVVAAAKAMLTRWTGVMAVIAIGEPPTIAINAVRLRTALDDVPTLRAFDAKARQAEAGVGLARADKHPDWSVQTGYQHRAPRFGDLLSAGVSIQLPVFAKNRQDPVIAARMIDVDRVRVEREAARRELAAQLDADLADHAMHHDRFERARATLVPLAQHRVDLETASYGAGTATLGDAQAALVALGEARLDLLNREADVARDAVRINLTYGSDER
jgi:cobalt-zinc-cadmium efflux system outer membrane protein